MIRAITDAGALYMALGDERSVYTEKIRSLADAYGFGYDFCRFWVQDGGAVIGSYYGEATAADCGHIGKARSAELAAFLGCGQFSGVLMPNSLYEKTGFHGAEKLLLMRAGDGIKKPTIYTKYGQEPRFLSVKYTKLRKADLTLTSISGTLIQVICSGTALCVSMPLAVRHAR